MTDVIPITSVVPEGQVGLARVEHYTVSEHDSQMSAICSHGRNYTPAGRYARLYVGGTMMMSDTPMERSSNWDIMRKSHGDVLIAGLGIGMVLTEVLKRKEVGAVTVIEKYRDVIDLVAPHYDSPRLTVICADIFEWKPPKGAKWDTIYFDIWPDICTDNLDDMARLHRRFARNLNRENPKAWMDSWQREVLQYRRRQDRRRGW